MSRLPVSWNPSLVRKAIGAHSSRPLLLKKNKTQNDAAKFLMRIGCLEARLGFLKIIIIVIRLYP